MPFRIVAALLAAWAISSGPSALAQFEVRGTFFVGGLPNSVVVGDFNQDGLLDVIQVNHAPASVEVLLGNGDGTFRPGATYMVGVFPLYATVASLRGNGILDLVVGEGLSDNLYVMLGNGDGTFQPPVAYPTGGRPVYVNTGQFTGTASLDIVALTGNGAECNCVEILPGNGDGTFGTAIDTPVPYDIDGFALAAGDFNNDGKLDVAVAGGFGSPSELDVLLGNGDGTFTDDGYYAIGGEPFAIASGYFTGDKKKLDLAVSVGGAIDVLLGNGDGTFQSPVDYETSPQATWLIAQDLDGDGKMDLAATNAGFTADIPAGVSVFKGRGDGTFRHGVFYPTGTIVAILSYIAAGDFNNDGKPDLIAVDETHGEIITLLNTGDAVFSPTSPLTFSGQPLGTASAPQTVTITNSGTAALGLSSVVCSGSPFRMKETTCKGSIAPGAQCSITIDFTAQVEGAVYGTVTIVDGASSKPQFVELDGIGTGLGILPTSLTFPTEKVGAQSPRRPIHLTNASQTAITFTHAFRIFDEDGLDTPEFSEGNNCDSQLAAGAECTIMVTFQPHHTGQRRGYLEIEDTGGDSPREVPLTGKGD